MYLFIIIIKIFQEGVLMKSDIKQVLSYLGVSPKYMGYYYIIDASDIIIKQLKRNKPILIDRIIKELAIK